MSLVARNKALVKFGMERWHCVLTRRWRWAYFLQSSSYLAYKVAADLLGVGLLAASVRVPYGPAGVKLEGVALLPLPGQDGCVVGSRRRLVELAWGI